MGDLQARLRALPVRTEILNVDTGETGAQSVELPLELRDHLLAEIARRDAGLRDVKRLLAKTATSRMGSGEWVIPDAFFQSAMRTIDAALQPPETPKEGI